MRCECSFWWMRLPLYLIYIRMNLSLWNTTKHGIQNSTPCRSDKKLYSYARIASDCNKYVFLKMLFSLHCWKNIKMRYSRPRNSKYRQFNWRVHCYITASRHICCTYEWRRYSSVLHPLRDDPLLNSCIPEFNKIPFHFPAYCELKRNACQYFLLLLIN